MKLYPTLLALALFGCTPPPEPQNATNTPPSTPMPITDTSPLPPPPAEPQIAFEVGPVYMKGKLEPLPGVKAPKLTKVVKVKMTTTKGDLMIEVYPEAAPNAAKRFVELVKIGYYDNTPIFRIEPQFVAQFGINSKPKMIEWKDKRFKDDKSYFHLGPGTLAFAKAGPDTNSTQVFINYNDNSQLVQNGNFTAFGKIVKGFEQTAKFHQVRAAQDQEALWRDTEGYLKTLPEKPDMIVKAVVVP